MNKKFDAIFHNQYTGNTVIERGYEIYDEWSKNGLSSHKIVRFTNRTIATVQSKRTGSACIEALSCVFALDARIKEKYNNLLRCFFSYFSWRRETRALARLRSALNFSSDEKDIRTAIEVELQKLRERLENEEEDDGDDETHGGKRNEKAEEETVATEEKGQEQTADENAEKITDAEEAEETEDEKTEDISEQDTVEEPIDENGEKQQTDEQAQEEAEITDQDEKEQINKEEQEEINEENNGPEESSEPSIDKKEEFKSYNDAVDSPAIYEETVTERSAEKTSFIDEMIIDNMVKGDKNIIGYRRIDEEERNKEANIPQDTVTSQNKENKSTEKDAYLYDKTLEINKVETQRLGKVETTQQNEKASAIKTTQQNEKVSEIKTEQPKETIQSNETVRSTEQEFKTLSEMLQADLNESLENQVIKELGNTMSDESREAYAQMQMDMAREKLSIAYAELGIDEPVEIIGMQEPAQVSRQSISPQIK